METTGTNFSAPDTDSSCSLCRDQPWLVFFPPTSSPPDSVCNSGYITSKSLTFPCVIQLQHTKTKAMDLHQDGREISSEISMFKGNNFSSLENHSLSSAEGSCLGAQMIHSFYVHKSRVYKTHKRWVSRVQWNDSQVNILGTYCY